MPDTVSLTSAFFEPHHALNPPLRIREKVEVSEVTVPCLTLLAGCGEAAGMPAANSVGQSASGDPVFGLGPDQWLVAGYAKPADGLYATDHSDAWAVLRVAGVLATDIMQALCPVDVHPSVFGQGACFQSNVGGNRVLVTRTRDTDDSYDLFIPRSSARAVFESVCDRAARL